MPTINQATPEPAKPIRLSYCGCDVRLTELCANCMECGKHCKCVACKGCHCKMYGNELCEPCCRCRDNCCCCTVCRKCQFREPSQERAREWCQNCRNCQNCCVCFKCTECGLKYEGDDRIKWHAACGKCAEHCRCMACSYRSEDGIREHRVSHTDYCMSCNHCKSQQHCKCVPCPGCGRDRAAAHIHSVSGTYGADDVACGKCRDCCRCRVKGIPMRSGKFRLWNSIFAKGEFKANPLRRHLSVEMEVDIFSTEKFSRTLNEQMDTWGDAVVRDGSIGSGGVEINTNPCNGDLFLKHIEEITTGLANLSASCTAACGLHVHVNVKGNPLLDKAGNQMKDQDGNALFDPRTAYTHYDLRRLILLYHKIEPALYMLCDPRRLKGRYSAICADYYMTKNTSPKDFRKDIVTKMYREGQKLPTTKEEAIKAGGFRLVGANLNKNKGHKYQQVRYKALNLHSFFLRGTIEFRHKEGTVDFKEVTNWALICGNVVDAASKMTEKDILALSNRPTLALGTILPDNLKMYAQEVFAEKERTIPRFKQLYLEAWRNNTNYEF